MIGTVQTVCALARVFAPVCSQSGTSVCPAYPEMARFEESHAISIVCVFILLQLLLKRASWDEGMVRLSCRRA
jgi:hypothetical protein